MNSCGVNGTASARLADGVVEWVTFDPAIHVSTDLLNDSVSAAHIREKYQIGDWCPEFSAYHAQLSSEPVR